MADESLRWTALLGRQDSPTDGVEDYCLFLGRALAEKGIELEKVRVRWAEDGWRRALRQISRDGKAWRNRWVLVQYTALSWSRHGFPFLALAVLAIIRRGGARVLMVFHEPQRQGSSGWRAGIRGACQDWVIRRLYRAATKALFTLPLDSVAWLPKGDHKSIFIPIGANIPERTTRRRASIALDGEKNVMIFGVTGVPVAAGEVKKVADIIRRANGAFSHLRVVVVGRGAIEAEQLLTNAFHGCNVKLVIRGVLPAEEITSELERADAMLFVRGAITLRRGSALAGIACGVPVVGYHNGGIVGPLKEAGIEWSPSQNHDDMARHLIRVLGDPQRWEELHQRNLAVQASYFSWRRIAEQYQTILAE